MHEQNLAQAIPQQATHTIQLPAAALSFSAASCTQPLLVGQPLLQHDQAASRSIDSQQMSTKRSLSSTPVSSHLSKHIRFAGKHPHSIWNHHWIRRASARSSHQLTEYMAGPPRLPRASKQRNNRPTENHQPTSTHDATTIRAALARPPRARKSPHNKVNAEFLSKIPEGRLVSWILSKRLRWHGSKHPTTRA